MYCEPYAGGAGGALELLFNDDVEQVKLNDKDYHIFAFWNVLLNDSEWLIDRIIDVNVNIEEWHRQRAIFDRYKSHSKREVAFATFFLNRCNRGGILLKAGPIGGFEQNGNYLIDARFNKDRLVERIKMIAERRDQISFGCEDAIPFIQTCFSSFRNSRLLMYIDPPYYVQGSSLYLNYYDHDAHKEIALLLRSRRHRNWVLSYDNVIPIVEFYKGIRMLHFDLQYSLQNVTLAKEIMVFSDSLEAPVAVSNLFMS